MWLCGLRPTSPDWKPEKRGIPQRPTIESRGRQKSWRAQALAAVVRRCWKHSRQRTGRPCVGLKGTVVSLPHAEQLVRVSTLGRDAEELCVADEVRLDLHALQRFGSFLNCLSWKNSCSPAVKTKSAPQSIHLRTLSWNSMETYSLQPATPKHGRGLTATAVRTGLKVPITSCKFQCSGTTPWLGPPRSYAWLLL